MSSLKKWTFSIATETPNARASSAAASTLRAMRRMISVRPIRAISSWKALSYAAMLPRRAMELPGWMTRTFELRFAVHRAHFTMFSTTSSWLSPAGAHVAQRPWCCAAHIPSESRNPPRRFVSSSTSNAAGSTVT